MHGTVIENLRCYCVPTVNMTNHDVCFIKSPGYGFTLRDCQISGNGSMTHVIYWETS
jgi:hypothetical protein